MLKNLNVDFQEFAQVIAKCQGRIFVLTEEGDQFNLRSTLSRLLGLSKLIEGGEIKIDRLICEDKEDEARIFRFLLYREI